MHTSFAKCVNSSRKHLSGCLKYVLALSQWKLLGVFLLCACPLDAMCMEWHSSKSLRKGYGAKPPTRLQLHWDADVTLTGHRAHCNVCPI